MGCFKISLVNGDGEQAYNACEDGQGKQLKLGKYLAKAYLDDAKHAHKACVLVISE